MTVFRIRKQQNISLQEYVATDPVDIPSMVTAPFIGGDRLGQSTAVTGMH